MFSFSELKMFSKVETKKKNEFLDKAKQARDDRAAEKHRDDAAIQIQALVRRYLVRCRINREIRFHIYFCQFLFT